MSLSVIQIGFGLKSHGLYDSTQKKIVLAGLQDEIFQWKNIIEEAQQQKDNEEYMLTLRKERIALLVNAGNTQEEAEQFLKEKMSYLYDNKN